jgi:quinol monooxygenase YgiN
VVSVAATRTEMTGFLSFSYMRRPQVSRIIMILEG